MWTKKAKIYGGDTNVNRAKFESLRGKFDDMRMLESENISQYCTRIKDVVNAIRGSIGTIDDETIVRKVLRNLLPKYDIRVFTIQELRCIPNNVITLEGLVGRLTTFELDNFGNISSEDIETAFKEKLTIFYSLDRKKRLKRYVDSDSETDDEDIDELEALLARRFHRGKGKYNGKMPIICFNYHEVGHIVARCPKKKNRRNNKDEDNYKSRDEKYEDKYKSRKDDD